MNRLSRLWPCWGPTRPHQMERGHIGWAIYFHIVWMSEYLYVVVLVGLMPIYDGPEDVNDNVAEPFHLAIGLEMICSSGTLLDAQEETHCFEQSVYNLQRITRQEIRRIFKWYYPLLDQKRGNRLSCYCRDWYSVLRLCIPAIQNKYVLNSWIGFHYGPNMPLFIASSGPAAG